MPVSGGRWAVMASGLQPMPTPGSPGAWKLAPPGLCVLGRGGRGGRVELGPVVAWGWARRGDGGGRGETPRPWGGDRRLWPSSAVRVRS